MKLLSIMMFFGLLSASVGWAQTHYEAHLDGFRSSSMPGEEAFQEKVIWQGNCAGSKNPNNPFGSWLVVDKINHPVFGVRTYVTLLGPKRGQRPSETFEVGRRVIRASNGAIHPMSRDEEQSVLANRIERHHNSFVGGTICNQMTYIRENLVENEAGEQELAGYSIFREPGADCSITNYVACTYDRVHYIEDVVDDTLMYFDANEVKISPRQLQY